MCYFRRILSPASLLQSAAAHWLLPHTGLRPLHSHSGALVGLLLDSPWGHQRPRWSRNNHRSYPFDHQFRFSHRSAESSLRDSPRLVHFDELFLLYRHSAGVRRCALLHESWKRRDSSRRGRLGGLRHRRGSTNGNAPKRFSDGELDLPGEQKQTQKFADMPDI